MIDLLSWAREHAATGRIRLTWDEDFTETGERHRWLLLLIAEGDPRRGEGRAVQIDTGIETAVGERVSHTLFEGAERLVAGVLAAGGISVIKGEAGRREVVRPAGISEVAV